MLKMSMLWLGTMILRMKDNLFSYFVVFPPDMYVITNTNVHGMAILTAVVQL